MSDLLELSLPFPAQMIEGVDKGGRGRVDTVSHFHVVQKLLAICGPFDWEIIREIRGYIPEWVDRKGNLRMPARADGVTGVIGRMVITIDDRKVTIAEVGTAENPHLENDGENAKKAASDALKRCAMRVSAGLHLWAKDYYVLPNSLRKKEAGDTDPHEAEPVPSPEPAVIRQESDEEPISEPESDAPVSEPSVGSPSWQRLVALLTEDAQAGTIPEIEGRTRDLYKLMAETNLWTGDAFHAALREHYDAQHWADLGRKAVMQEFAQRSFDAARTRVRKEIE